MLSIAPALIKTKGASEVAKMGCLYLVPNRGYIRFSGWASALCRLLEPVEVSPDNDFGMPAEVIEENYLHVLGF